jgi:ribosomal protein S18 acetylase RimI-like enzyme
MPEPDMRIHRATAADAWVLSRLSADLFPLGCPANTKPADIADYVNRGLTPERFLALLDDKDVAILVVEISDKPAGYALIARNAPPPHAGIRAEFELRKFYIATEFHGRGIANALMNEALAMAKDEGSVWLSVFSGNRRAISFYEKWGFRIAGTQNFLVGSDPQKDHLMQREAGR